MGELKHARWVTYTRTPRSLHPGEVGRGWLSTANPPPDGSTRRTPPGNGDPSSGAPPRHLVAGTSRVPTGGGDPAGARSHHRTGAPA